MRNRRAEACLCRNSLSSLQLGEKISSIKIGAVTTKPVPAKRGSKT